MSLLESNFMLHFRRSAVCIVVRIKMLIFFGQHASECPFLICIRLKLDFSKEVLFAVIQSVEH